MNPIESSVRQMRMVQMALLVAIVLYGVVGERIIRAEAPEPHFLRVLVFPAFFCAGGAFFFRRRMVQAAEEVLRLRSDDSAALARWRVGNITCLTLCEAVALWGFALRMLGGTFLHAVPFYAVAILLILAWTPRLDVSQENLN